MGPIRGIAVFAFATLFACAERAWPAEPGRVVDFAREVQPIFQQRCLKCHGGVKREGGLSLLGPEALVAGKDGVRLVVSGRPEESELIRRVTTADPDERMPAGGPPLPASEIETLRRWIAAGGAWPKHWSFAPIVRPDPPAVKNAAWVRNPIDRFVLARLEAAGIEPSREAQPHTLIRRLHLDLTGLPPTLDDVVEFEQSAIRNPQSAIETLVDRLLASPHFGERWGRHWLDLARYADSDGYEVDKPRPDAYRWRNWVIEAVNRDLPLDQFTVDQFAGDLLEDATTQEHLATAYHRQTLTNNEGGVDKEEYRFKAVIDRVSNTGAVWLGLTLGCAQCHNHPYDPFTQQEFYELAAIFNNADETEIELPQTGSAAVKKFRVLSERPEPRVTRLLHRGDFLQPKDEVQPGVLGALHAWKPRSQRASRLDLAGWLMHSANPLTPRVQANQLWRQLFGRGLVRTPDDFGARGEPPTHLELLDWLAGQYREQGWSRKAMIRLIVASATYRQASEHRPELEQRDPQNQLLARQNRFRVEAEIVPDLHLAVSGLLSRKIGGPSVFPPLPAEMVKITFRSELPWKASQGEDRFRRGMYTFFKRSVPYPELMLFDCPDASAATVQRGVSNTPLQALATLHNETFIAAARAMGQRVLKAEPDNDGRRIDHLFRLCLARPPSAAESARLLELLSTNRTWYQDHPQDAQTLVGASQGGANSASAPDQAALIATASMVMNLDEFITRE